MPVGAARDSMQQLGADEARKADRAGARRGAVAQDSISIGGKRSGGDNSAFACQAPHVVWSDHRPMRITRRLRQDVLLGRLECKPERGQYVRKKIDPKQLDRG